MVALLNCSCGQSLGLISAIVPIVIGAGCCCCHCCHCRYIVAAGIVNAVSIIIAAGIVIAGAIIIAGTVVIAGSVVVSAFVLAVAIRWDGSHHMALNPFVGFVSLLLWWL